MNIDEFYHGMMTGNLDKSDIGNLSDGYHTFNELYHHRAVLFSVIVSTFKDYCWKSKLHHDGSKYDGMFIVGIDTPNGQATYHYDIDPYWDMFDCKELERAPLWDGHTPAQAIERISQFKPVRHGRWKRTTWEDETRSPSRTRYAGYKCSECYRGSAVTHKYCPACGARMDTKEDKSDD